MKLLAAYFVSIVVGHFLCLLATRLLRRSMGISETKHSIINTWLGVIERATATTLYLFAPSILAVYIGGWTALKFAAGWNTKPANDLDNPSERRYVFLVGCSISFAVAIAGGIIANPNIIKMFATISPIQ